jgi:hypothetical protein
MKLLLYLLPVSLLLACHKGDDKQEVRDCFDQYKAALKKGDGKAATELVDSSSINYYSRQRDYALDYDSTQLMGLPVTELVITLLLKQQMPADSLMAIDGKGVFIRSLETDAFADKEQLSHYTISNVKIDKNTATVSLKQDSIAIPLALTFHKESGDWKISVSQMLIQAQVVFEEQMKASGKTKKDIIDNWFQSMSPEQQAQMWQPMRKR